MIDLDTLDTSGFEQWQQRLIAERQELDERLFKLKDSMRRPTFMLVPVPQRELLQGQSRAMERYLHYLDQRIGAFIDDYEPAYL